jgi:hypothetical protein
MPFGTLGQLIGPVKRIEEQLPAGFRQRRRPERRPPKDNSN